MPFKSIRSKIDKLASGEILGEGPKKEKEKNQTKEVKPKVKKEKPVKPPKVKKEKPVKVKEKREKPIKERAAKPRADSKLFSRHSTIVAAEEKDSTEEVDNDIMSLDLLRGDDSLQEKDLMPGYEDVLEILGIKKQTDLNLQIDSGDLDYIEFGTTTPVGFNFEEVTDFISRIKFILKSYEDALHERDKDVLRLASEAKRTESRMIAINQEKEMAKMIGGMTQEERLIEENLDLKVTVNELKGQLKNTASSKGYESLQRELEILRNENAMLIMSQQDRNADMPSPENVNVEPDEKDNSKPNERSHLPSIDEVANKKETSGLQLPDLNAPVKTKAIKNTVDNEDNYIDTLLSMGKKEDPMEKMIREMEGEDHE